MFRLFFILPRRFSFGMCVALLLMALGCASTNTGTGERINPVYRDMIRDWQMRIEREGWSNRQVNAILAQFRGLATYRGETRDRWDTPGEFMQKGFSGDCEDIVVYMMGTLKKLGYPYGVRVLIARSLVEDHALLTVQMPDTEWRVYDVAPPVVRIFPMNRLEAIVEFDEKQIKWHPVRTLGSYALTKTVSSHAER